MHTRRSLVHLVAATTALVVAPAALAHSSLTPGVTEAKLLQQFTLDVQAEQDDTGTVKIELTVPQGFAVETFATAPGWRREVAPRAGEEGEEESAERVTWTGSAGGPREDPVFHFTGSAGSAGSYAFKVRQTYADGSVTDWAGPEGSEQPAAFVHAVSAVGGSSTSTLALVALALAAVGVVLGLLALATRAGGRPVA